MVPVPQCHQQMPPGRAQEPGPSPWPLTAASPQLQVPPAMGLFLLAVALVLGGTAATRCPAACVCDNLRAHVLCLNRNLTAVPGSVPEVGEELGEDRDGEGLQPLRLMWCFA